MFPDNPIMPVLILPALTFAILTEYGIATALAAVALILNVIIAVLPAAGILERLTVVLPFAVNSWNDATA